jgi:hypothetical protein
MKTDREVMQQALEALETGGWVKSGYAIAALYARLAEPETCKPALQVEEAEPVAWINDNLDTEFSHKPWMSKAWTPLYAAPPTRRPLTDEEIWDIAGNCLDSVAGRLQFARAIERAHKI